MSTLAEIEEAIARLPRSEFRELLHRSNEREADAWDRQIEEDASSGRLEGVYQQLMKEEGDRLKIPLDEVFGDARLS